MSLSENQFQSGPFREEMYVFPLSVIEPEFFGCLGCGLVAATVLASYFIAVSYTVSTTTKFSVCQNFMWLS
jgi:hypothetical protein